MPSTGAAANRLICDLPSKKYSMVTPTGLTLNPTLTTCNPTYAGRSFDETSKASGPKRRDPKLQAMQGLNGFGFKGVGFGTERLRSCTLELPCCKKHTVKEASGKVYVVIPTPMVQGYPGHISELSPTLNPNRHHQASLAGRPPSIQEKLVHLSLLVLNIIVCTCQIGRII